MSPPTKVTKLTVPLHIEKIYQFNCCLLYDLIRHSKTALYLRYMLKLCCVKGRYIFITGNTSSVEFRQRRNNSDLL